MSKDTLEMAVPAAASTREWLFKAEGQVFGPVPEAQLVELLFQGRIGGGTEVAGDDGAWRPLAQVPGFLVHLKKAEARARVEAEVTGARKLARRRSALQGTAAAVVVVALVAIVGAAAWFLATRRPWERRSNLLDDFGDGIAVGSVRVGGGPRAAADDEIAIPDLAVADARPKRAGAPRPPRAAGGGATGSAVGGELVLAQYDPSRIQQVVARRQGSLAPCLREEASRSPEFAGEIPIEFAVGNDGKVSALWIDEPRFKSGPLRECILARLREWSFDPFPGQRPVVSLAFKIGSR